MAARRSAGILLFRTRDRSPEVLLAHMGGPFWQRRDDGAWSLPKGEYETDEDPEAAARREFVEELGLPVPPGALLPLGEARQRSGKVVTAWALEADLDPDRVVPGTFELEWPPRSGKVASFPEVDKVAWFDLATARTKLVAGQHPFLERLEQLLPPAEA